MKQLLLVFVAIIAISAVALASPKIVRVELDSTWHVPSILAESRFV